MKNFLKLFAILLMVLACMAGCKKDDSESNKPSKNSVILKGKVIDEDNKPVANAKVTITAKAKAEAFQKTVTTNNKGEWSVEIPENTPVEAKVTAEGIDYSVDIPGYSGGTTQTVSSIIVPPGGGGGGGDGEGEPETNPDNDRGAVRYAVTGQTETMVITGGVSNGKIITRNDLYVEKMQCIVIVNHELKEYWTYLPITGWMQNDYNLIPPQPDCFASPSFLLSNGYVHEGTKTVAGKLCQVYSGPAFGPTGKTQRMAVWNGLVLYNETDDVKTMEAVKVTLNVPDKAFSRETIEVDWI
ncbi:MAG: carboxypeptidase-like regulatory domain-containing protein [Bacteroidales bacterium]|nr:carboxypeptidase-like regulatory domain-containing protein [Bacteroidales bacterium]